MDLSTQNIKVQKHPLAVGGFLAQVSLCRADKLNALTLAMVEGLYTAMRDLAGDSEVAAVFLDGDGERAFCAGGDVRAMRESALAPGAYRARAAEQFFETEYRLNHLIHHFPKPVLCWGHGFVMGGGMGLLMGASHRIATPSSSFAMPEVALGMYPDVGSTWFLRQMPGYSGLFFALTGVSLNAGDALYGGIADYLLPEDTKGEVLSRLLGLDWQYENDTEMLTEVLTDLEADYDEPMPVSHLKMRQQLVDRLCEDQAPAAIEKAFEGLHGDDVWLNRAGDSFRSGSALSARIVLKLFELGEGLSLADALRLEMVVSANTVRGMEFIEGVRSLLVDKDRHPQWAYSSLDSVPDEVVGALFESSWATHPLADL